MFSLLCWLWMVQKWYQWNISKVFLSLYLDYCMCWIHIMTFEQRFRPDWDISCLILTSRSCTLTLIPQHTLCLFLWHSFFALHSLIFVKHHIVTCSVAFSHCSFNITDNLINHVCMWWKISVTGCVDTVISSITHVHKSFMS